jgi:hypothetical protein
MTLSLVGTLSVGQMVPIAVQAVGQLSATVGSVRATLNGQLQAKLKLGARLTITPPRITATLSALAKVTAKLQAAASLGVVPPSFVLGLDVVLKNAARLQAYLGGLAAQVSAAASITSLLATAGIDSYSFGGATNAFGPAVTSATSGGFPSGGGPSAHCDAIILITTSPAAWTALGLVMAVGGGSGLQYNGSVALAAAIPTAASVAAGVSVAAALALPSIALQITSLAKVGISIGLSPPSLTANITALGLVTASAVMAAAGGISPPGVGVSLQVAGNLTAIALLQAQVMVLDAALAIVASLNAAFGIGGIVAYHYSGPVSGLGPELTAATARGVAGGAPADPANALILATTSSATWASMGLALKTS